MCHQILLLRDICLFCPNKNQGLAKLEVGPHSMKFADNLEKKLKDPIHVKGQGGQNQKIHWTKRSFKFCRPISALQSVIEVFA